MFQSIVNLYIAFWFDMLELMYKLVSDTWHELNIEEFVRNELKKPISPINMSERLTNNVLFWSWLWVVCRLTGERFGRCAMMLAALHTFLEILLLVVHNSFLLKNTQ